MSGPDTRDPNMVKMPRDMHEFMMDTTRTLARIEQKLESHLIDDKEALGNINARLDKQSGVVSSINDDRSEVTGGWKALRWVIGSCATLAALIIAWFHK